jgi:hypothetical protein
MPRALGSNRAIRITSWSPSIHLQPLAANDVGVRYTAAIPLVITGKSAGGTANLVLCNGLIVDGYN